LKKNRHSNRIGFEIKRPAKTGLFFEKDRFSGIMKNMMILINAFFYFGSFFLIWYASGIIISSLSRFTDRLKMSSFAVSFFVLGIMTSIPEFAVGISSIIEKKPGIFIGNLLGASLTVFILIIPLLAIFGNGVKMIHQLTPDNLIFALLVVAAPTFLIADNVLTRTESIFLIILYLILFYYIERKSGLFANDKKAKRIDKKHIVEDLLELGLAGIIVFVTSRYIVGQTVYFSEMLSVSPFLVSVIALSLGTNLPELSLALRSVIEGKREVALGDYLGSAAANTLFFGIFTLLNGSRISIELYSYKTMVMMLFGLGLFYYFSRSKQDISRREGKILLLVYVVFVLVEVFIK